jgi:phospholipid/cholesterol/gamma-HCH transport system permease protein
VSDTLMVRSLTRLGVRALLALEGVGEFGRLAARTGRVILRPRPPLRETLRQFESIAVRFFNDTATTEIYTGMVLALQTAYALTRFGAKPYVGSIVGLAIVRELGPVLAALMVGGRVGAGITAEIGSMRVTEQIDAIRAMGADPVQKLVLPRVLAATLALPLLTVIANVVGVFGGMLIADVQYGISPHFYLQTVLQTVNVNDFLSGVSKTFVFGCLIAMVGCHAGLRTEGGTVGVGQATTRAVVAASISVLVADFFLTKLLMLL